jgi:hypothetical protein
LQDLVLEQKHREIRYLRERNPESDEIRKADVMQGFLQERRLGSSVFPQRRE